ncbi:Uncharacterised protein [Streptococcus pneumoniae]|nr:Uncharacterised protein [Streptococcus pneumoniae]
MAKSNFEKVESVVGWVRDKKITGYRISKETNAVKCLSLLWRRVVQK